MNRIDFGLSALIVLISVTWPTTGSSTHQLDGGYNPNLSKRSTTGEESTGHLVDVDNPNVDKGPPTGKVVGSGLVDVDDPNVDQGPPTGQVVASHLVDVDNPNIGEGPTTRHVVATGLIDVDNPNIGQGRTTRHVDASGLVDVDNPSIGQGPTTGLDIADHLVDVGENNENLGEDEGEPTLMTLQRGPRSMKKCQTFYWPEYYWTYVMVNGVRCYLHTKIRVARYCYGGCKSQEYNLFNIENTLGAPCHKLSACYCCKYSYQYVQVSGFCKKITDGKVSGEEVSTIVHVPVYCSCQQCGKKY